MKRRNRTISILSMSALDVLAMATGVFVLLLVMLMPYYRKTMDAHAEIEGARIAAAESLAEVQALQTTAARHRAEARAANATGSNCGTSAPSSRVPFSELRSSTYGLPSAMPIRMCRRDTLGSSITRSHSAGWRPTTMPR